MYRKIQCKIWADRKFLKWHPQTKLLFFYLITGRHSHQIPGVIVGNIDELVAAMKSSRAIFDANPDAIPDAFKEVIGDGSLWVSDEAPLMFLPNALKHNKPVSINVVISWGKSWAEIPECTLKDSILKTIKETVYAMHDGFADAFRKAFADAIGDTETETETENNNVAKKKNGVNKRPKRKKANRKSKHSHDQLIVARGIAETVIPFLEKQTSRKIKITDDIVLDIKALVHEGFTRKDILHVFKWSTETWSKDYRVNCTPSTLLDILKFKKYIDRARSYDSVREKPDLNQLRPVEA